MDTKLDDQIFVSSQASHLTEESKPEIPSSEANIQLAQEKTDTNRITEIEPDQSGSRGLNPFFQNKDIDKTRRESYGTTSEGEQAESSYGCQFSNFRNEWSSLEVCYSDIMDATNNLSESSEIGKGGYGSVYKGKLGGKMVAIKILDPGSKQGEQEFFQELEVLYGMRHPNLVKLVGACFKVRALVYEYLPNGSLGDCLKYTPRLLTWQMRTRIIYEICSALIHLHSRHVVHGDLKPANILLDANFRIKLSDFGLCRFLPEDMTSAAYLETVPKGTSGYIDPWFLETWILRPGSDLYSFGITILKLLTGLPPVGLGRKMRDADENSLLEMIDPTAGSWPLELAKELVYWSLQCCYRNEKSSKLLEDMSTCLEDMLAEIETLQEGRFKANFDGTKHMLGNQPGDVTPNIDLQPPPIWGLGGTVARTFQEDTSIDAINRRGTADAQYVRQASPVSNDVVSLPGIEGFQICGEAKPGCTLTACGYSINGTSHCFFQWVRYLENGARQSIGGATSPEYVVTADDFDTILAVECIPMNDSGHEGKSVSFFANSQNKIKADADMEHASESHISSGRAPCTVFLLEITAFLCRCFIDLRK